MSMMPVILAGLAAVTAPSVHPLSGGRIGATWTPVYGLPPAKPVAFVTAARKLGSGFARVTLYWTQLEPAQGVARWDELDAYLAQVVTPDEGMITISSASPWATRVKAAVFPSSPAKDPDRFYAFVRRVVERAAGRVRYFQADTEPSNPFFWSGSASDYAKQQRVFYRAVKDADPRAVVVLGGSDGLFDPTSTDPLPNQAATISFLKTVLAEAQGAYDVSDLHLYADPYTIPGRVRLVRSMMREAGGDRPFIASEVSGPGFFEFKQNRRFASTLLDPANGRATVSHLRRTLEDLPMETRMFLDQSGSEARVRLLRVQSADLMIRNVLALAAGVQRAAWFSVWADGSDPDAPRNVVNSPAGLLDGTPQALGAPTPLGRVFARVAGVLGSASQVVRVPMDAQPDLFAYRVARRRQPTVMVAWRRPAARGALVAPLFAALPARGIACSAAAIDGTAVDVTCRGGTASLPVGDLPIVIGLLG